jgi:hypothetical protein
MAIVERQTTTTTRTGTTADAGDTLGGILIVLAIIIALGAAYFAYDYYAATPDESMMSSPTMSSSVNEPTTVTPAQPDTTAPAPATNQ